MNEVWDDWQAFVDEALVIEQRLELIMDRLEDMERRLEELG